MKYEFHVGDYVETSGGHEGYILKYSCFPDEFPATWYLTIYHKEYGHSTVYEVRENCFPEFFNRIGRYDFTKKDKNKIESLDYTERFIRESTVGSTLISYMKKINELVDAVNELRKANSNAE